MIALGDRAVLFARPRDVPVRAIVKAVRAWDGAIDCVVTRDEVAVYFDRAPQIDDTQLAALAALREQADEAPRIVEIGVIYDGPDIEEIARAIDGMVEDVARIHAAAIYTVEMMGFAPGFAYLTGLDPKLAALPRRATPRTKVLAGSLAVAGGYTAVYPFDSPGGWHLLGRVDAHMFGPEGALLRLGDRVRFLR